jgi:preprotein translocase subunit YajC
MSLIIIVVLFVIAWVVLILPKQRELRRHNALLSTLAVGDEVMTGSGMYGTLVEINDDSVLLQVAPGTELKVALRSIAAKVVPPVADDVTSADSDATADDDDEDPMAETDQ